METQDKEIMAVSNKGELESSADSFDAMLEHADRRITQYAKARTLAIKLTNPKDWTNQQGNPYLGGSGCEKVARPFGICWKIVSQEKKQITDDKSSYYIYVYVGQFTFGKDSIEAIGTCSSRDQFFAKEKVKDKDGKPVYENGKPVYEFKLLSEIDETNILKSAYTNMIVNGVTRIIGLRNVTWEMLAQAGITKELVSEIKYASGGKGGGKISEAQFGLLMKRADLRNLKKEDINKYVKEKYNLDHLHDIEKPDFEAVLNWVSGEVAKQPEGKTETTATKEPTEKEKQDKVYEMLMQIGASTGETPEDLLEEYTSYKSGENTIKGLRDISKLVGARLNINIDKIEKALKKIKAGGE